MSHKLYMAMRNMIALAIPGNDWTDPSGEQALADAHAACTDYEDRLANSRELPRPSKAVVELFYLRDRVSGGEWVAHVTDGTVDIPGHNTVQFDDGYDAALCAGAKNALDEIMEYLGDLLFRLDALRAAKLADVDTIARQEQTIAAQNYVISKQDDIIFAVQNPHGMRLVAEMHARQIAEQRVTKLEITLRKLREEDNNHA